MSEHKLRVSAKGFFFDKEDRVLLIKGLRKDQELGDYWAAPGGGVEEDESLKTAVERELIEETGYYGKVDGVVFVQDFQSHRSKKRQLEVFFRGEIDESQKPSDGEVDHEFQFFTEEEFKKIIFLPEGMNPFEIKEGVIYSSYL